MGAPNTRRHTPSSSSSSRIDSRPTEAVPAPDSTPADSSHELPPRMPRLVSPYGGWLGLAILACIVLTAAAWWAVSNTPVRLEPSISTPLPSSEQREPLQQRERETDATPVGTRAEDPANVVPRDHRLRASPTRSPREPRREPPSNAARQRRTVVTAPLHELRHPPAVGLSGLDLGHAMVPSASILPTPSTTGVGSPATEVSRTAELNAVLRTVTRYAEALTRMDVREAAAVWPSVDQRMLSSAFQTLAKHRVMFDACTIDIPAEAADTAVATCHGLVEFVPKVGRRAPQLASQQWRFTMNRVGNGWQIQTAHADEGR